MMPHRRKLAPRVEILLKYLVFGETCCYFGLGLRELVAIKVEREDRQTNIIMGKLKKFVAKEITKMLEPLKQSTEISHEILQTRLGWIEIRLVALEREGPSSDGWSLQIELQELRAVVHALQAHNNVTLEDPPLIRQVDISKFVTIQQIVKYDNSLVAFPADVRGKRKRDEGDEFNDIPVVVTRAMSQSIEEQNV
ncbi:hypothetical protein K7X08_022235 [Anisodus acutangulus]|uniref:Uncharacterized protein n=1 Tax=Anisodus acutangulus TaxID=402998 RepID=A0A9Q1L7X7_9SOLA|nr:hypothetical protein K7X08_022235 [Anisodus acutangulus]